MHILDPVLNVIEVAASFPGQIETCLNCSITIFKSWNHSCRMWTTKDYESRKTSFEYIYYYMQSIRECFLCI